MKKLLYIILFVPLLFIFSCEEAINGCLDSQACNYNAQATIDNNSCIYPEQGYDCEENVTAQIGDVIEGGYLFYLDETGKHGLVAATEDLGQFEWGCYGTDINGNNSSVSPELDAIGTGLQNTLEIVSSCSETPIAAREALAHESEGYSDWFLPSKDELIEMYNTIGNGGPNGNIGGFVVSSTLGEGWYWSSSEYSNRLAWFVGFNNGNSNANYKNIPGRVRVIRSF